MKKSLILSMVGLMLGILSATSANVTNSTENLVFGKMWMEGSLRAGMAQRLHVEVTNKGTEEYQDFWWAGAPSCYGNSEDISLAAGETKDVAVDIIFEKEGHHEVIIMDPSEEELFTYTVDIAEYQTPRLKGEIRLDMLERTDDGNLLYGDFANFRITGTATVTNEENYPYFGMGHIMSGGAPGLACVIWPWFGHDYSSTYEPFYGLPNEIRPGETITKDILYEFVAVPEEDQEYGIQICTPFVEETIASIPFKVRQCTNTYWTADGHVKPIPVSADQVLKVPNEAIAVDMRGQYEMNTIFSIDVSEANPNCLYYLGYLDNVPQGFTSATNVIRDYEVKDLIIDADYDYFCPMPFKAKTAILSYRPVSESWGPAQPFMSCWCSGSLTFPFEVTWAWFVETNESPDADAVFSGQALQVYKFLRDDEDKMYFDLVTENRLNAYEPYIMRLVPALVNFYAEDVMVPSTRPAVMTGKNFDFIGHTTQVSTKQDLFVYPWYADYTNFYRSDKEELIRPFNAMMYAKTHDTDSYDQLEVILGGSTKIDAISINPVEKSKAVYSLSGQRVETLRPGIYIIGGKKVLVK